MGLLPSRDAWRRWDWPTRFGIVTGLGTLALSAAATMLWLFSIDLGEAARSRIADLLYARSDPWEAADPRRAEEMAEGVGRLAQDVVDRLNQADLSEALDYHRTYADGRCFDDDRFRDPLARPAAGSAL